MMPILIEAICSLFVFCLVMSCFMLFLVRPSAEAERMLSLVQSRREDLRKVKATERLWVFAMRQGSALRHLGLGDITKLRRRLVEAGLRGSRAPDVYIIIQVLLALSGALLGSLIPVNVLFWVFAGGVVGFMAPDFWLTSAGNKRKEKIRRGIPDAVDLLGICVNAGLGLDQASLRVGEEIRISHPELHEELRFVNFERRAGTPRSEAWTSFAARVRIEEITAFASMLAETDRFGTPITQALTSFSAEIRTKRRQRAEEAAAKTKIKIVFPLVLCIFPCIFIVLLAPALLTLLEQMKVTISR